MLTGTDTPYQYWILRYIPNTVRQEFVNIGVIVGRSNDWAIRTVTDWSHAARLGGNPADASEWLSELAAGVEAHREVPIPGLGTTEALSEAGLSRLQGLHNNQVQIADGGPMLATDANAGANMMFDLLVHAPGPQATRKQPRARVRNRLHQTLEEWAARDFQLEIVSKPHIEIPSLRIAPQLDFASINAIIGLHHAWAFDTTTNAARLLQQFRAWEVPIRDLRHHGASFSNPNTEDLHELSPDSPISVLFAAPPTDDRERQDIFDEARDFCTDHGIRMVPEDQAEKLTSAL